MLKHRSLDDGAPPDRRARLDRRCRRVLRGLELGREEDREQLHASGDRLAAGRRPAAEPVPGAGRRRRPDRLPRAERAAHRARPTARRSARRSRASRGCRTSRASSARTPPARTRSPATATIAFATVTFDERAERAAEGSGRPASSRPQSRRARRRSRSSSAARRSSRPSRRRSDSRRRRDRRRDPDPADQLRVVRAMGLPIATALLGLGAGHRRDQPRQPRRRHPGLRARSSR